MGDVKLAMAVGAIVGPLLAVVTMLVTALAGGVMALGDPANDRSAWKLRRAPLRMPTSDALTQATRNAVQM